VVTIKRKKVGKRTYYYLQHSIRKGSKVQGHLLLLDHRQIQNTIRTYCSNCTKSNILITVLIQMRENEDSYNFNNEIANHGDCGC
jgi:hypothetical protein